MNNISKKYLFITTIILLAVVLVFVGIFYTKRKQTEPVLTISEGWQVLTSEKYGFRAIVPKDLEFAGCRQPVKMKSLNSGLTIGALLTPCPDPNLYDTMVGIGISFEENIYSAEDAQKAIEKTFEGNCRLDVIDWKKDQWKFVATRPSVNEWAPSVCGMINNENGIVRGFYNEKIHTFVYWKTDGKNFPIGPDLYADDQVRIEKLP